MKEKSNCRNY